MNKMVVITLATLLASGAQAQAALKGFVNVGHGDQSKFVCSIGSSFSYGGSQAIRQSAIGKILSEKGTRIEIKPVGSVQGQRVFAMNMISPSGQTQSIVLGDFEASAQGTITESKLKELLQADSQVSAITVANERYKLDTAEISHDTIGADVNGKRVSTRMVAIDAFWQAESNSLPDASSPGKAIYEKLLLNCQ